MHGRAITKGSRAASALNNMMTLGEMLMGNARSVFHVVRTQFTAVGVAEPSILKSQQFLLDFCFYQNNNNSQIERICYRIFF